MAIQMGVKQGQRGLVDFSLGEKWSYVSFTTVLGWLERGDVAQLERTFGGRPVLLGVVSPLADRVRLPVPLMAGEPYNLNAPAVMLHGQVLRSMLNKGLVQEAGRGWVLVLTLLAALFWFGRVGLLKATLFLALPLFALAYSSIQLWYGLYLPVGSMLLAAVAAFMLRWAYEIVMQLRQRQAVRDIFRSYVSPQILEKILAGKIRSGLHNASKKRVCVLIADIRHFAARTEKMQPEEVIALLNDYFSEMTIAIHKHDGTLDKFIGDGLMAFFGAPLALESPEKSGLEAAQEMLVRLRLLNERLVERGVDPLEIGIGLHIGVAVIGHVGSESRHDYTALGDVVNTASRLEEMTKRLGYPVVCSEAVARVVGKAGNLADLGEQDAGQEKMRVFGWNPQVLAEPR